MTAIAKRLGKRISQLRRAKGLTSESLAYGMGVSKGYLSDLENGKKLPSLRFLDKLAKELGVTLRDFF